jgi:prepilin-type N-terminal cleavage/methylation domain-containing protein
VCTHRKDCRGFTLIELIASITIISILAAVMMPRFNTAQPFDERGYADGVAASLRQSRSVALASGCDVQFTINAAGYSAFQHGASATIGGHCASAGAWTTPVRRGDGNPLSEVAPAGVVLAANRVLVFAADGSVGGNVNINLGLQTITIDAAGTVQGP